MRIWISRYLSSAASNASKSIEPKEIFLRQVKRIHRDWAAKQPDWERYEFLRKDAALNIIERLNHIKPKKFKNILELGGGNGTFSQLFTHEYSEFQNYDFSEYSPLMLSNAQKRDYHGANLNFVNVDEDFYPFAPSSYDLIVSSLSLQWVNDPQKLFSNIRSSLTDDGVFIFAILGGSTLNELSTSLQNSELNKNKGFFPRVAPFASPSDVASMLFISGYVSTTVDYEVIKVEYPSLLGLFKDLRGMGETNCTKNGATFMSRKLFKDAEKYYTKHYTEKNSKYITATYEIIYGIGWKMPSKIPLDMKKSEEELIDFSEIDKL